MMAPNEILKDIEVGLAVLIALSATALASIAFRYRKQVIKAEKFRWEVQRLKTARERESVEEAESEDHHRGAVLSR